LTATCDELLSTFAFKFNLRRYTTVLHAILEAVAEAVGDYVGWGRVPVYPKPGYPKPKSST
jgi:hypothetical protein